MTYKKDCLESTKQPLEEEKTKQQLHSLLKELQNTGKFNQKSRFYKTTIAKHPNYYCIFKDKI